MSGVFYSLYLDKKISNCYTMITFYPRFVSWCVNGKISVGP